MLNHWPVDTLSRPPVTAFRTGIPCPTRCATNRAGVVVLPLGGPAAAGDRPGIAARWADLGDAGGARPVRRVLSLCGALGGAAERSGRLFDLGFVVRTLLEPSSEVVRITDVAGNETRAVAAVDSAPGCATGRARPAPATAVAGVPAWSRVHEPRPAEVAEAVNQAAVHDRTLARSLSWGGGPVDVETRAGGNPSWNTRVDYREALERSSGRDLVTAACREAGAALEDDLASPAAADGPAVRRLRELGDPTGRPRSPVVTLHALGDPAAVERSCACRGCDVRPLFVDRAGHCMHTAAEQIVALRVLGDRISTGHRRQRPGWSARP